MALPLQTAPVGQSLDADSAIPMDESGAPQPQATGAAYLAKQRSTFKDELDANPGLKNHLATIVDLENPTAGTAVAESLMNRMAMMGGTIAQGIGGGENSFYGPVRRGEDQAHWGQLNADQGRLHARLANIDEALAGSNYTQGHTDQGSQGDPNYEAGGTGVNINGERFNDWGGGPGGVIGARAWRQQQQREAGFPYQVASNDSEGFSDVGPSAIPMARDVGAEAGATPLSPQTRQILGDINNRPIPLTKGDPSPAPNTQGAQPIGPFENMPKAYTGAPKDRSNYWLKQGPNDTYSWVPKSSEPDLGVGPSPLYHPDQAAPANPSSVFQAPETFGSQVGRTLDNFDRGGLSAFREQFSTGYNEAIGSPLHYSNIIGEALAGLVTGQPATVSPVLKAAEINPLGQETALGQKLNAITEPVGEGWPTTLGYYAGQGLGFALPFAGGMATKAATGAKALGTLLNESLLGAGSGAMQGEFHDIYQSATGRTGDVGDLATQIIGASLINPLRVAAITAGEKSLGGISWAAHGAWQGLKSMLGSASGAAEGAEQPLSAELGGKLMDATLAKQFGEMMQTAKNHVNALSTVDPADSAAVMAAHAGAAREAALAFAKNSSAVEKQLFGEVNRDLPRDYSGTQTLYRQMMRDHFDGTLRAQGNFPTEVENLLFPNRSRTITIPDEMGGPGEQIVQKGLDQVDGLGRGMDVKAQLGSMLDDELAAQGRSVDRAKVGYLKRLQSSITADLQHGEEGATADEVDGYRRAMAFSAGRSRIINSDEMQGLLDKGTGAPQAMEKLLAQGPQGQQALQVLLGAASKTWGSEGMLGAAQDYIRQKYRNAVAPAGYVSQDAHNRFMTNYGALLGDPAFSNVRQQLEQAAQSEQRLGDIVGFGKPGGFGPTTGRQAAREDAMALYANAPADTMMEALEGARNQVGATEKAIEQLRADPSGQSVLGLQHKVADRILGNPKYMEDNAGIVKALEAINPGYTDRAKYWTDPSTVGGMAQAALNVGAKVVGSRLTRPLREGDAGGSLVIAGAGAKFATQALNKFLQSVGGANSAAIVDPAAHAAWQRQAQHLPSSFKQQALDAALLHAYVPGMLLGNFGATTDARPEGQLGLGSAPASVPGVGGAPPATSPQLGGSQGMGR